MVNKEYEPTDEQDRILDIFKEGRDTGDPWGHANPRYLRSRTDLDKGTIEYHLRRLTDAGWIRKVDRGFYEFVTDPRDE